MQKHEDNLASRINGNALQPLSGVTVTVVNDATGLPAALYSDNGVTLITAPIVTDANGYYSFYAADGKYTVTHSGVRLSSPVVRQIILEDPADNPAATLGQLGASGGGALVKTAATGAGASVRSVQDKLREFVSVFDFGAVGDGVADDTAAALAAIAAARTIHWGHAWNSFRITAKLTLNIANQNHIGEGTLLFDGANTTRLADVTANDVTLDQIKFSGNNKQPRSGLVFVAAGVKRPKFRNVEFKNILGTATGSDVLNQTYALLISPYAVEDFEIVGARFADLRKHNDGTYTPAAVGIGFIGGICFMNEDMSVPSAAQPIPSRGIVQRCVFDTIQTILAGGLTAAQVSDYNDADAIRTYSHPSGATRLYVSVSECDFIGVSKRAFKLLASGADASKCRIYATGLAYGMTSPINVGHNSRVRNIDIIATSALPVETAVQWTVSGDAANTETLIDGITVSHCKSLLSFFSDATNAPLRNLKARNFKAGSVTTYGIQQGAPTATTQSNLSFENFDIVGSGNVLAGIDLSGATDGTTGYKLKNIRVENGSVNIAGRDPEIDGFYQLINSAAFVGPSAGTRLFRAGDTGAGGATNTKNIFINALGLSPTFLSATRTQAILFSGDNAMHKNIRIKLPETLTQVYPHFEFYGNDAVLDGFEFDSPGVCYIAQSVGSQRWAVRNAKRIGGGASSSQFLYTGNAGSADGLFDGITDFRPTTASTITVAGGARFIATNVASRTSNVTIVALGGVTKTANLNTF